MTQKHLSFRPRLEALEDRCLPSFSSPAAYPVGTAPQAVVTADVNGDGKLDLITANLGTWDSIARSYVGGGVSVLLGLAKRGVATGTFGAAQNYDLGSAASLAVGDLNRDGKPDIVTGSGGVLLGNGNGTFRTGPTYAGGLETYVALADVNNDGKLDIITAAPDTQVYWDAGGAVSVLLGNGDGTFRAGLPVTASADVALALGDFNGDGKLDLITATNGYFPNPSVNLLPGNGDGTFGAAQTIASLLPPNGQGAYSLGPIAVADLNADGKLDVAYTYYYDGFDGTDISGSTLLGNGDGTFANQGLIFWTINNPSASRARLLGLVAADFNHDGKLDLITIQVSNTYFQSMSVLLGDGGGGFGAEQDFDLGLAIRPTSFAVGDFNGDGYLDMAVVGSTGGYNWVEVNLWSSKRNPR